MTKRPAAGRSFAFRSLRCCSERNRRSHDETHIGRIANKRGNVTGNIHIYKGDLLFEGVTSKEISISVRLVLIE